MLMVKDKNCNDTVRIRKKQASFFTIVLLSKSHFEFIIKVSIATLIIMSRHSIEAKNSGKFCLASKTLLYLSS